MLDSGYMIEVMTNCIL